MSEPLNRREQEILALVAEGNTNADIGTKLRIGETTVKTHLSHAMAKLGTPTRIQAVIAYLGVTPQPHCGCCAHVHHILDTRRPLRHRIPDNHPWARLYDDIRTALEETS
jgi:DNA-binding CsgD family transcriptional regulator